ncbi:hypothetical protein [Citrobacter sp. MGH106]|uniref:hypothetical protein n=1 Tax=Citrobacter sp. MGH106 TaxID=1686381 RepID=UPI0006524CAE|nr:hypothetical protein [Citrobacter sp. MGH106]KLV65952.1 hypothetical protein SK36_00652 [Citrobacter sp. MGH106]
MKTNHPAHSPVSLDRLHQISEILSKAAAQSDGGNLGYAMADAVKVIDGAIAAFGAEPVAWIVHARTGDQLTTDGGYVANAEGILGLHSTPLYRHAQPAQTGVDDDVRNIIGLLETNEWAEHCTETVLGSRLEAEITRLVGSPQPALVVPGNCVTAEHRRVIEMLLNVCGAAFELADDSCQQDVDGEECHVVPDDAFQKLSDALDEIENTLPTEDVDRPDVFLAWSAMPRAALKSILQAGNSPVTPDGYVLVPIVPTEDMIINGFESVPDPHFSDEKEWEEYEALSGCRQAARRDELCWAAMIKAAPKQENI